MCAAYALRAGHQIQNNPNTVTYVIDCQYDNIYVII